MNFLELIVAGIPGAIAAAVVGLVFGCVTRRIEKREKKKEEQELAREEMRKQFELYQVQMTAANAALGKANAIALQNGKCNGETKAALQYLETIKHNQRDFLLHHGVDHIF